MKAVLKKITPFISILFFGLALWFLDQEMRQYDLAEITGQLSDIPDINIVVSLVFSILSYLILTGYDGLGIRYIGEHLATGKIMRAGYISYAFSHNVGLALITGGSIRYRIYSAWGFSGIQVTQIVAFSALTLWIGFCSVAGLSLLFATPELPNNVTVPFISLRVLGIILLIMVVGYVWASARVNKELSIKGWSFSFPDLQIALKQVVLASVDWLIAAMVLFVLLPEAGINFFSFVGIFLLAQIIGLFSQVPGGLGVFESVMLLYLSNFMNGPAVLGILLVYRIIYYILPLLVAMIVLAYQEYITNREVVKEFGEKAVNWLPRVMPQMLSISVFVGGAILLFSGSVPSEVPRMQWLQHFVPLPVIEMSHFLASLAGAALLVLARGLQRRIDAAWHLTVALLLFGIIFTLLRGGDYEEAIFLSAMLGALLPCRDEFHRKASLLSQRFSMRWIAMILIVIFSSLWLGIFSYRNLEYQKELWWQFTLLGDAPRYLRASVAVLGSAIIFGLIKLLRPEKIREEEPEEHELAAASAIIRQSSYTYANLALTRYKDFLFNEEHTAFIMYAAEGNSMIAMGDPLGPEEEMEEIIWKYKELCEEQDAWTVFYQVREEYLNYYIDLGLTLLKLGEVARVPLSGFNAKRADYDDAYAAHQRLSSRGFTTEIIPPAGVQDCIPRLKTISEAWLDSKNIIENKFSTGFFSEEYIANFPAALVKHEGRTLAFSTIWAGLEKHEISFDLLRYLPEAPEEIIDFLLIEMMQWGKNKGYEWFNLGMAPFAGMDDRKFSPRWNRLAGLVYTYGDNFYRFKGRRNYRQKFKPVWEPRFLACPPGLALPAVLSSLTTLISGGITTRMSK